MSYEDSNSLPVLVKDIMTKALISVNLTTTAFQIANMMKLTEIDAILVKENGVHVGIVTDRDFATKITANNLTFDTPVEKNNVFSTNRNQLQGTNLYCSKNDE